MKKRIFSGIQPSGSVHIGNYLGAIQNWVNLQDEFESIFCIVDLHAITVPQDPEELRKKTIETAKIYLAAGINPEKSAIFVQSHVKEHAELAWVLNTIAKTSELAKMTQFKDKSGISDFEKELKELLLQHYSKKKKQIMLDINEDKDFDKWVEAFSAGAYRASIDVGLYDYPVLMAADILLYDTQVVPVGEDQVQHIELARTLARRFNKRFGDTFMVPKAVVREEGKRIMSLLDPLKKMSKSDASAQSYINLLDSPSEVRKKIKKAVTDSGAEVIYSDDKPAIQNLINIYSSFSGDSLKDIEKKYRGKSYADFKEDLAEVVADFIEDFQVRFNEISDEKVLEILNKGAEKVRGLAEKKMDEVKKKVGFLK